ncbi:MAG: Fic family protein [Gammaproteobacteria bacterium]|nr:Fic family protein [Gammaproteobacteria bacterium]
MKVAQRPKQRSELFIKYAARLPDIIRCGINAAPKGRYLHWDKLRHLTPPCDLNHEEWWLGVKFARSGMYRTLPLKDIAGQPFSFTMPDIVQEKVHLIDRKGGGRIELPEQITTPETRDRYIFNSLVEEAITSSQLEGASTTRQVAADMLRNGTTPRNTSEQMIFNNFEAMNKIRSLKNTALTPETVLDLHKVLTRDTLDDPAAAGKLQDVREERVRVIDNTSQQVLHTPPPANQLPDRLVKMCEFANDVTHTKGYVHPIIRAIILHFWLAYDHPFIDGNGRTARALFYWSMLAQDYWLFEFVSISRILKEASAQYGESYLHSETDDNDLTYFIIHQLDVIIRAIADLEKYLQRKMEQTRVVQKMLKNFRDINHRQLALLGHAIRHPGTEYSIRSHQTSHSVAYATARADLFDLADKELLVRRRLGKKILTFMSPPNLEARLRRLTQN